jgi:hypothetical protein
MGNNDTVLEIRKDGEQFLRALNEELYRNLAGLKRESNLRAIYKSYPILGDPDVFFSVKDMFQKDKEENGGAQCNVPPLLGFLASAFLGSKTAKVMDKILTIETGEEIHVESKKIPYRSAWADIKKEPKRTRREEMDRKRREIVLKLNPLFLELLDIMHSASVELGFLNYTNLCDEIERLNLSQLEEKTRLFLDDTEYIYRDLLGWFFLKRMELKLKDAKRHDLYYLLNSFELKANFPKVDLKELAKSVLGEMGIEVRENIKADLEKRKGKTSKAFCIQVEIPQNIIFSVYPIGSIEDYESFFYGLGSALCYAYTEREDDFESRRIRESALVEVFGHLLKNLILQPRWLKRYLKLDAGIDFLRFLYLRQLMIIRYYSGKLIYELTLHKDEDFRSKSDFYKQTLKSAHLCEYSEADYLVDVEPFFYTASRLKASIIEAGLRWYLRERFDEEWWRKKEAGDFIHKMWKEGGKMTSEEISKRVGFKEISLAPLLRFFQEVLG